MLARVVPGELPEWLPEIYREFETGVPDLTDTELKELLRYWFRTDLWFLLVRGLHRADMIHPWMYQRVREVQEEPDGCIDLWARDHRKSTIITFAKTIQDILASHGDEPLPEWQGLEPTFGVFSHTRPIAKQFLRQIKTEFEQNGLLKELFPDVLYERPEREAPRWSQDDGLVVRRKSNPKEATIEAWGLVDGQPTSKHFDVLIYDDVVVQASVTSPEMIQKTTTAWEQSLNLGTAQPRTRIIGTRWSFADSYRVMMDRGIKERKHPATEDGTLTGKPVYLTAEQLREKIKFMGPYTASAQLLLNPIVDSKQTFDRKWFDHRFDPARLSWEGMNRVLIVDPANSKKKYSDWSTYAVIGLNVDRKRYLLDFIRDRLGLIERTDMLFRLHKQWKPHRVGYEEYGMQSDIEHIQSEMNGTRTRAPYHFDIEALGGSLSKPERINRLIPICHAGELWLPESRMYTNYEHRTEDLIQVLIEQEFTQWPVPAHDDGMDVISRQFDMEPKLDFPEPEPEPEDSYQMRRRPGGTWMSR